MKFVLRPSLATVASLTVVLALAVLIVVGMPATAARAQDAPAAHDLGLDAARDPTRAPPGALAGPAGAQAAEPARPDSGAALLEGTAVILRDGKPYLASGTRLYGVGQQLGSSKIERITETEVWLRSGTQLQKIQRFEGIQRRAVQP